MSTATSVERGPHRPRPRRHRRPSPPAAGRRGCAGGGRTGAAARVRRRPGPARSMQSTGSSFAAVAIQQWVGQTEHAVRAQHQLAGPVLGGRPQRLRPEPGRLRRLGHPVQLRAGPVHPDASLPVHARRGRRARRSCTTSTATTASGSTASTSTPRSSTRSSWARSPTGTTRPSPPSTRSWSATSPTPRSCRCTAPTPRARTTCSPTTCCTRTATNFTAAQNGLPRRWHPRAGQPTASWPIPTPGQPYPQQTYPGWAPANPVGQSGSDNAANYVSSLSSQGSITYVETAYAKEHNFPVAILHERQRERRPAHLAQRGHRPGGGHPPLRPDPGSHQRLYQPAAQRLSAVGLQLPRHPVLPVAGRGPRGPAAREHGNGVVDRSRPRRGRRSGSS